MDSDMAVRIMPNDSASNAHMVQTTMTAAKLTGNQQIAKLKEEMDDEEQSAYLDAQDMNRDFYSAKS